jgi:hypothetical protein
LGFSERGIVVPPGLDNELTEVSFLGEPKMAEPKMEEVCLKIEVLFLEGDGQGTDAPVVWLRAPSVSEKMNKRYIRLEKTPADMEIF